MDIDEPGSTQHSELLDTQMDEQVPVLVFPESLLGAKKPLKVEELTLLLQVIKTTHIRICQPFFFLN
jgi:hypothetical protein